MKRYIYLIKLINDALEDGLDLTSFAEKFDYYYVDNEDIIKKEMPRRIYDILSNFHEDLAYFEPDEGLQKEHESYFGKENLIKKMREVLRQIQEAEDEK